MKVVVVGGTGLIGSRLVGRAQRDHAIGAVAASPNIGRQHAHRRGRWRKHCRCSAVVDVSNSPSFEDRAVLEFFETSTRNLLDAEAAAGVGHHVVLSIVGTDRLARGRYFRAKMAQEKPDHRLGYPVLDRPRDTVLRVHRHDRRFAAPDDTSAYRLRSSSRCGRRRRRAVGTVAVGPR